ncbi:MAG: PorP/SprF family type IX secretion system membrane protein [Cytophagales bacterium]|nr:PorP/SprF family type IX secretion system membrane protein [Cytophagales bacterium]
MLLLRLIAVVIGIFFCFSTLAVDPQFTQFYAAPLYLNPAMAGATPCWRAHANYRNQWFLGPRPYSTYMAGIDKNFQYYNLGAGAYMYYDNPGGGNYSSFEFAGLISYLIKINYDWRLRFGLQPSYHLKSFANQGFTYGNNFDNLYGAVGGGGDGAAPLPSLNFFDLSTGFFAYNQKIWIGLAAHHLLRSPLLLPTSNDPIPLKISLHGGIKINLNDEETRTLRPAANLRYQGNNIQSDLGLYYNWDIWIVGAWYRGIPFLSRGGINHDALCFLGGIKYYTFMIGYSYDLSLSSMINSLGTHEIGIVFEFCAQTKKPKPPRYIQQIPCPKM